MAERTTEDRHILRLVADRYIGFTSITLDGAEIPNVTEVRVTGRRGHAVIELTIEAVDVEIVGDVGDVQRAVQTTATTETYTAGVEDLRE